MSLKRKHSESISQESDSQTNVFRSAPIEDRSSTFIGIYSPTVKPKDLQSLPEIQSASHKILGWRRESNQQSINKSLQYVTGSDDDGEKYGGKRVEKVLESSRVAGSCVVARWYGGVLLGPVRFNHIETCAQEAIRQWQTHEAQGQLKRQEKLEADAEHEQLSKALVERDQSIVVLRALAQEKELQAKSFDTTEPPSQKSQPPAAPANATADVDYARMPLARLKALDKARDATLAFLLKRIEKAEAGLTESAAKESRET